MKQFTLAEIRNGTGFERDARFVLVSSLVDLLEAFGCGTDDDINGGDAVELITDLHTDLTAP